MLMRSARVADCTSLASVATIEAPSPNKKTVCTALRTQISTAIHDRRADLSYPAPGKCTHTHSKAAETHTLNALDHSFTDLQTRTDAHLRTLFDTRIHPIRYRRTPTHTFDTRIQHNTVQTHTYAHFLTPAYAQYGTDAHLRTLFDTRIRTIRYRRTPTHTF